MKKTISLLLSISFLVLLVACTPTDEVPEPGVPVETIDHIVISIQDDWDYEYQSGAELSNNALSKELTAELLSAFEKLSDDEKAGATPAIFDKNPMEVRILPDDDIVYVLGIYAIRVRTIEEKVEIVDIAQTSCLCVD